MILSRCSILDTLGNIPKSFSRSIPDSCWCWNDRQVLMCSSFAKQIYPSNFTPSPCHRWIKLLEEKGLVCPRHDFRIRADGQLLRNYTQNIDTLESQAGVEKVLQCHGRYLQLTFEDPKLMSRIIQNSFMPRKLGEDSSVTASWWCRDVKGAYQVVQSNQILCPKQSHIAQSVARIVHPNSKHSRANLNRKEKVKLNGVVKVTRMMRRMNGEEVNLGSWRYDNLYLWSGGTND